MIGFPGSGVLLCKFDAFLSLSSLVMITSVMTYLKSLLITGLVIHLEATCNTSLVQGDFSDWASPEFAKCWLESN